MLSNGAILIICKCAFTGLLKVMNKILTPEEKERVVKSFIAKIFSIGAQCLYKDDPDRDSVEKSTALDLMLKTVEKAVAELYEQAKVEKISNIFLCNLPGFTGCRCYSAVGDRNAVSREHHF